MRLVYRSADGEKTPTTTAAKYVYKIKTYPFTVQMFLICLSRLYRQAFQAIQTLELLSDCFNDS